LNKTFTNPKLFLLFIVFGSSFACSQIQKTIESQPGTQQEVQTTPSEAESPQSLPKDFSWSQLGSVEEIFDSVNSLAVAPEGTLYALGDVKGSVRLENGNFAKTFAKWNGFLWSEVGIGVGDAKKFVIAKDGTIYASIHVRNDESTGDVYEKITKWDGNRWSDLGDVDGFISCMLLDSNGVLYAAGMFQAIGGIEATNVAKWDGNNWSAVGAWGYQDDSVSQMAIAPNGFLYVIHDEYYPSNLRQWDGVAWTPIQLGADLYVTFGSVVINPNGVLFTSGIKGEKFIPFIGKLDETVWSFIDNEFNYIYQADESDNTGYVSTELIGFSTNGTLYIKNLTQLDSYSVFSWDGTQWLNQFELTINDPNIFSPAENSFYTVRYLEESNNYEVYMLRLKNP